MSVFDVIEKNKNDYKELLSSILNQINSFCEKYDHDQNSVILLVCQSLLLFRFK